MNGWFAKKSVMSVCLAVAAVVIFTLSTSAAGVAVGSAPSSAAQVRAPDSDTAVTIVFTKWIASVGTAPVLFNMGGVVSGAAGAGQFVGEITSLDTSNPAITKITALYHINGGTHQLTARVNVTQDNNKGTATIVGVVTDGWLQGAKVEGGYQVISPCGIINAQQGPLGDVCFQGTLHVQQLSEQ